MVDEYNEDSLENQDSDFDNDELSAEEDGFLRGYEQEDKPDDVFDINSDIDEKEDEE